MGGNLVLKLLGEWGTDAPPQVKGRSRRLAGDGPCAFCRRVARIPPTASTSGNSCMDCAVRILRKADLYPGHYDVRYLRGLRSLRSSMTRLPPAIADFATPRTTTRAPPLALLLDRIAVPTLVLHAQDDPFIRVLPETRAKLLRNPHITFIETARGGHCAFLAAATATTAVGPSARPSPSCSAPFVRNR